MKPTAFAYRVGDRSLTVPLLDDDALEKEMPVISTEPSEDELLGGGGDVSPDVVPTDDED